MAASVRIQRSDKSRSVTEAVLYRIIMDVSGGGVRVLILVYLMIAVQLSVAVPLSSAVVSAYDSSGNLTCKGE